MSATPKEPSSPVILNVDNDESVRYTRSRVLSDAGYRIIDATTGEEALVRAAVDRPDLIILTVILPGIDGLEVCRRLKADQETSYIMVLQVSSAPTSKTDLAAGVEGGADGYLIEPIDPVELLATVRALLRLVEREKDNRRLIQKLIRSERQLTEATSAAEYGLWDWHIPSGELEWCGVHERLAGMFPGAFSGKVEAFADILHPDDRARVWKKIEDLINTREERFFDESRFVHLDGSVHWMAGTGRIFYDKAGHAVRMTGVIQDITDRKQAENKLKQYRTIMAGTADGIALFELNAGYIEQNMAHRVLLGYSDEDLHGLTPALHLGDETFRKVSEELIESGRYAGEVRSRRKDGQWLDFSLSAFGIYDDKGDVLCYVGIMRDISERKRQEAVLRESEARFSAIFEQSTAGIAQTDLTGRFMLVNDRYCEMTGRSREMLLTLRMQDITHPDDLPANLDNFQSLAEDRGGSFVIEKRYLKPDGTLVWVHNEVSAIRDVTGRKRYITAVAADITENKKAEHFIRRITDMVPGILYVYDLEERRNVWGNKEMFAWLRYSHDQIDAMANDTLRWMVHPDDWPRYLNHAEKLTRLGDGEVAEFEYRMRHADGSYRWLLSRATVFERSGNGMVKQIAGSAFDITERKQAEDAMLAAHNTFRHLVEQSPFGVYAIDADFRLVQVSAGAQKLFESVRPLLGRDFAEVLRQIWPDQFAGETSAHFRHTLETGEPYRSPKTVERRQDIGNVESYDWKIERVVLPDGRFGVVCHFYDLSERQRYEQQLAAARQHLQATLSATEIGVWHWDLTDDRLHTDGNLKGLFGLEGSEDLPPEDYTQRIHSDDFARNQAAIDRVLQNGGFYDQQFRVIRPDGTLRWLHSRGKVETGEEGRRSFVGVVLDITERKHAEEALRESEERFRTLADNMSQFAWMADQNGWIFWYNRRWFDYTGTTLEDMQGWGWEKVHHPDHLHRVIKKWQHALETGHEWEDTFPLRGQDGHYRWFLSRAVPIRDTNGPVLRWFGTNTDVTDLREAEQAQAHLAAIVTSSDDAIISKDLDGVITSWNQAAERLFGYTAEEVVGRSVTILMPPEHLGEEPDILKRIRQGRFVQYETIRRRKDGTLLDISLTVSPIKDEEGRIIGASKVARDITERRRQEEELRRLKEELEVRVQERTAELLATQGRLMTVTSQLSLTEQRERRKLARDLHDYLAQMLVVGQMKTGMLKKQLPHNPTSAALLQDLDKVFQQALVYTRTLIAELNPPSLEDSGLLAALKWLGERFEKDGLRIDVRADCNAVPLVEEQAVVVFQAVRELLFNVMKHSGVGGATVTVTMNEDSFLRVAVADQGIGFSSDAWQRSAQPGHLGLVSVRERFRAMGGAVDVESRLGQGTTVTLVLPVTTKASGHPRVAGG